MVLGILKDVMHPWLAMTRHWLTPILAVVTTSVSLTVGASLLQAQETNPVDIKVIGGLGSLKLYNQHEKPFWQDTITKISQGRIKATIHPFDKSGLRGEDMLQLMRMGVVPFGTALLGLVVGDEPELSGVYLASLGTKNNSMRETVAKYRPRIANLLRDRYGLELLAIYAYPDQVPFCAKPFAGLEDLAGKRIRTSHVAQSDLMIALGATPVVLPFLETMRALKRGDVDCAITGTMGGNESELFRVTTHIGAMGLTPGLSIFAANLQAWDSLPEDVRTTIATSVKTLEQEIWEDSQKDTDNGIACNTGRSDCTNGKLGDMILVEEKASDRELMRHLLATRLLPQWIDRCGENCISTWNDLMAESTGLRAGLPSQPKDLGDTVKTMARIPGPVQSLVKP